MPARAATLSGPDSGNDSDSDRLAAVCPGLVRLPQFCQQERLHVLLKEAIGVTNLYPSSWNNTTVSNHANAWRRWWMEQMASAHLFWLQSLPFAADSPAAGYTD